MRLVNLKTAQDLSSVSLTSRDGSLGLCIFAPYGNVFNFLAFNV